MEIKAVPLTSVPYKESVMLRKYKYLYMVFAVLLLLGVTQQAHAILAGAGGRDIPSPAGHGFSLFYTDGTGLSVDLCVDPTVNANGSLCILADGPGFIAANPVAFPANFPEESFYYLADAIIGQGGNAARYSAGVEALFAGGPVLAEDQGVINTIVIKLPDIPPGGAGTYTVTHPYGKHIFPGLLEGPQKALLIDTPIAPVALDFTTALTGAVGPYLHAVGGPIQVGGVTFIGDPGGLGSLVVGSPTGFNKFRIEGPGIAGAPCPGGNGQPCIETDQFTLLGKATGNTLPVFLQLQSATYTRGATSGSVAIRGVSTTNVTVAIDGLPVGPLSVTPGADGAFSRNVSIPNANLLPASIILTGNAANPLISTPTTLTAKLVDAVTITKAQYNSGAKTLIIQAKSGDAGPTPPALRATGAVTGKLKPDAKGKLTLVVSPIKQLPTVTVQSSKGGLATAPVVALTEKLKITTAKFDIGAASWLIKGTTNVPGAVIRLFNSGNLTNPLLGKVTADKAGVFKFILTNAKGSKLPNRVPRVSAQSSGKGKVRNKAVSIVR
jgi:hypothetical protein